MKIGPQSRWRHLEHVLAWSQRCLIVFGVSAIATSGMVYIYAGVYQSYQSWLLEQRRLSVHAIPARWAQKEMPKSAADHTPVRPAAGGQPAVSSGAALSLLHVLGRPTIGRLEIPRLGVSVMVLEGAEERTLRLGAGHVSDTALPGETGNVGIAAHRDTFFRPLRNIRKDDRIRLTTPDGVYSYRVESMKVVGPEDTYVLVASLEKSLTLFTCYPFDFVGPAPRRFVVRARQIKEE